MLDKWVLNILGSTKVYQDMLLIGTGIVQQGFSTRLGGVSKKDYAALNLALHVGDNVDNVNNNRNLFSKSLSINKKDWVSLNQIHSDKIIKVGQDDRGKGAASLTNVVGQGDGLITNQAEVPLVTYYADCISLFIVDQVQKAIGLAHAGWKGTWREIGQKTLVLMGKEFGTKPADCKVAIGPGIGQCCYEVDQPIYELFKGSLISGADTITPGHIEGKWQLDLKLINWLQFVNCGVPVENISVSSMCTSCHQDLFFSYRGAGGQTGRMAALLMLK